MKIIVFDLPASESGALAILKDFYQYILKYSPKIIEWELIISTTSLENPPVGSNINILRFPETKKNWLNRIRFELFYAARLVREYNADIILSLQNIIILGTKLPQVVYVHQSLPYVNKHFSYFRRYERFLAFYADIFRPLIAYSVRKAVVIIVQTTWLKNAIAHRHHIDPSKIAVIPPSVRLNIPPSINAQDRSLFFYPTTPFVYKNIELIIEAVCFLHYDGLTPHVLLTIRGDENNYARFLLKRVLALGLSEYIRFIGRISRNELVVKYQEATLLFPSKLESFGLPLLEARIANGRIVAADTPFSREILVGYPYASFHGENDVIRLASEMKTIMVGAVNNLEMLSSGGSVELEAEWAKLVVLLVDSVNTRK